MEAIKLSDVLLQAQAQLKKRNEPFCPTDSMVAIQAEHILFKGYMMRDEKSFVELARWMAHRQNAPQEQLKGLYLHGRTGAGKTAFLTKIFTPKQLPSASELVRLCLAHGVKAVEKTMVPGGYYAKFIGRSYWDEFLDDMGTEPQVMTFGTKFELMADVIDMRYRIFTRYRGLTYITSNLNLAEVTERYGERTSSRIAEMCEVIKISADDMRLE